MEESKKWDRWEEEERTLALRLHKNKNSYAFIAKKLNKSFSAVNGFFKRHQANLRLEALKRGEVIKTRELPPGEEQKRVDCHTRGLSDKLSAKELGMSQSGYATWRISRNLESNVVCKNKSNKRSGFKVVEVVPERKVFTVEDLANYRHNKPVKSTNFVSEIKIINDPEAVERELARLGIKRTGELNKGVITIRNNAFGFNGSDNTKREYNAKSVRDTSYKPQIKKVGY